MVRRSFAIALSLALSLLAVGCRQTTSDGNNPEQNDLSGAAKGAVELQFWHTQTTANAQALEELVTRFNQAHEGQIRVRPLYQGSYPQLYQKTMAAIVAKRPPEVAVGYESMVAEYMKAGIVQPLDEYLTGPDAIDAQSLQDIFPGYLESNRFQEFDNKLLSFPFTKSVLVLYYNLDALKEAGFAGPPKTWDEFEQAVVKTTRRDASGKVTRYGFGLWADASTIDGCIYSRGGALLTDDRKRVRFHEEPGLEHFRLMARLAKQGIALRSTRQQYTTDFGNGRMAMFIGSSTAREFVTSAVGGKFAWGCTVIPQANPDKPVTVQYGANMVIFKTTPEKQRAAWKFVRWLAEPEQTIFWATRSSYMPLRASVAQSTAMKAYWRKDPQARQCFAVAPYGIAEPNIRGWQDVRDLLEQAFDQVVSGQKTPEAALAEAETRANAALKEKQ